ncbi:hypothetical protein Bca52824_033993 [Brassica carinata]|uniref:Uncharacterized protein n=1 Tax=Brassica carinata TaxID=52824 RepID=A0A8X7V7W3_BRACI|nr:hypothetical protein Bca52824_033993 [Brassica carinata]
MDAHYGIPLSCWCTQPIIEEVSPIPKYPTDCHTFPGSRYFICKDFDEYGLHFRRPWVIIVLEELQRLRKHLNKLADEIEELSKKLMSRRP